MKSNKFYGLVLRTLGLASVALGGCGERPKDDYVRGSVAGYTAKIAAPSVYGGTHPRYVIILETNKSELTPKVISGLDKVDTHHRRTITIDGDGEYEVECKETHPTKLESTCDIDSKLTAKADYSKSPIKVQMWKDMDEVEREKLQNANELLNQAIIQLLKQQRI